MARPFDFNALTVQLARLRQDSLCACCGESLDDVVEHAHHVIPNQSGDPTDARHAWLRSEENCVLLCDICHERVHGNGNYRNGAVAPPSYYLNSHGVDRAAHTAWVLDLNQRAQTIWA